MSYFTVDKVIYQRSVRFIKRFFLNTYNFINPIKKSNSSIITLTSCLIRVGAAIYLLNKKYATREIMLKGRWKSETNTMRYLQSWNNSNWLMIS